MEAKAQAEIQERVKKLLGRVQGLPTLPSMLLKINKLLMNPRTSAKEVAQLITTDPAIASKVLRVVNSSFYGFSSRITTVTHAIVILGFNTIKSIVLSSSIFDVFKNETKSSFNREAFWKHSVACGAASKVIANRVGEPAVEEIFLAGLLHDIGKIVLDQFLHPAFLEILADAQKRKVMLRDSEFKKLGFTHAEIGAWMFSQWNLSKALIDTVRCHHSPGSTRRHRKSAAIVHLADILIRALGHGDGVDRYVPPLDHQGWEELGFEVEDFDGLLEEAAEEIERASVYLDFVK
jgi:putative nucleotidyltransferase with HDIG domain